MANKFNSFGIFFSWADWQCIENAHGKTFVMTLCIDVNEITSLLMTAGYALGFIWCDGSGRNTNCTFFQAAKRRERLEKVALVRLEVVPEYQQSQRFSTAFYGFSEHYSQCQIFEPWEELRVEASRMTEIPGQQFLSGVVVEPTTQLSVFCTVDCCEIQSVQRPNMAVLTVRK